MKFFSPAGEKNDFFIKKYIVIDSFKMATDSLVSIGALALAGLSPSGDTEADFIRLVRDSPELLELYEGDRFKIWFSSGCPQLPMDIIIPQWHWLSEVKKTMVMHVAKCLCDFRKSFYEYYPQYKDKIPNHLKGPCCFVLSGRRYRVVGNLSTLLRANDNYIIKLSQMTTAWYYIE